MGTDEEYLNYDEQETIRKLQDSTAPPLDPATEAPITQAPGLEGTKIGAPIKVPLPQAGTAASVSSLSVLLFLSALLTLVTCVLQ